MKELLVIYIKENDDCMIRIDKALTMQDHDDIRAVAHKMKGSSRIVGAFVIESMANLIEKTVEPYEIESMVAELQDIYAELKKEIHTILAEKGLKPE